LVVIVLLSIIFVQAKGPYKVVGNKVIDGDGKDYKFFGVDRPSLEWGPNGDHISQSDFQLMRSWGANVVRIALNQDYWLKGSRNYSASYNQTVYNAVQWAHQSGLDVILDLHWSDKGNLPQSVPDQQRMADVNSIQFWKEVAAVYKGDVGLIYELYNEPHDVSWDVWQNGGPSGEGWTAVGMQQLYEAVRSAGATNPVIIGGLNWGYDLSGVPTHLIKGDNIIYNTHPYNYGGKQPENWDSGFGFLTENYPIIATEFGNSDCTPDYYQKFLAYAKSKGIMWTAWAWYPGGCTFPALILDWAGNPSVSGKLIKEALQNQNM